MKRTFIISVLIIFFTFNASSVAHAFTRDIDFCDLFEHHGSIMIISDWEVGEILYVNKAAIDFYGYSKEQLESMRMRDLNTLAPGETRKGLREVLEGKEHNFIHEHVLASGEIRIVEINSYPYVSKDKTLIVAIVNDITERTRLEKSERILLNVLGAAVVLLLMAGFLLFNSFERLKNNKDKIQKAEEDLLLILNSTAEAIYGVDMDGNCTFCNTSCLKLLGYKHQDELLGENMHLKIHNKHSDRKDFPPEDCYICKAFARGEGIHIEDETLWRADGISFPAEYSSYPQYRNGKIIGGVATFADITERKQFENEIMEAKKQLEDTNKQLYEKQYSLEEQNAVIEELNAQLEEEVERYQRQKEVLRAIINSIGAGIVMVGSEGETIFINKAWRELFSYLDFEDSYDSGDSFYVDSNTGFGTELFIRKMLTGMQGKDEIFYDLVDLTKDKDSRYSIDMEQTEPIGRFLNLYSNPCVNYKGEAFGRIFVIRDISHQKEVDRLKLELINTVSHELRTPMSSILGFSELLLTRELSEVRYKEYIEIINSEARRLTDLINDFLDIQRMESGKLEFKRRYNSIDRIIREAVKVFENIEDKHRIIYNSDEEGPTYVYCDREKILQVLSNLLSNAVKYSPEEEEIKVELTTEGRYARISVTDYGFGIPEYAHDKIFTKFYRIDNGERIGGTGLGLTICKEIVRAHEGEIGVDSTYGLGSTFYFYIPLSEGISDDAGFYEEICCSDPANNRQILIVEDDIAMVKLIREVLGGECIEMHSTDSGEEALRLAKERDYRLFILDIALKGQLNGWDVVRELKNQDSTAAVPIIISSVYENKGDPSYVDILDYLVKPFEPKQLVGVVRRALNGNLDSKMMVNGDKNLKEKVWRILKDKGINVKDIESSGDILVITLDKGEGLSDEK
ncbi:MAG TPA: PAS domain S-box protein [Clostridia bacterium]|nr:PAS domain S-box protein [Clostridia bacterium]